MDITKEVLPVRLNLFDGEGTGGTEGSSSPSENGDAVVYGKQEAIRTTPARKTTTSNNDGNVSSDLLQQKNAEFEKLISEEYKQQFTDRTQQIINRRFKETKEMEARLSESEPVLDMLKAKYKVESIADLTKAIEDDDSYWEDYAYEMGLTVEQAKQFQKLERENAKLVQEQKAREGQQKADAQMTQWIQEAEALKQSYPDFDLQAEVQNPQFLSLLQKQLPMEHAYKLLHYDELMSRAVMTTQANTEKRVVDNVRARGTRPQENGTTSQSAFTVKDDVSKLTKADRAEIARRAARGEKIRF